ncbi:hypothetical protein ARALYDRAFT_901214 [Arabidopsis lyrata subsp. lyrata]|uniref:Uncharacterized protein n=1 Tax=Arabidopsis lyrata subsp. lyrata TaxID=81972 RepID=D7LL76_ARALL|nr:hypothetical protein ARALYDRAFT_901214 [Arabidopsis lyrata subsp. lyrata]
MGLLEKLRIGPKIQSTWQYDYEIALFARIGLHCHNFQKGTNYKFKRLEKCGTHSTRYEDYYITFEATAPTSGSVFSFQTMLSNDYQYLTWGIGLTLASLAARIKATRKNLYYLHKHNSFYSGLTVFGDEFVKRGLTVYKHHFLDGTESVDEVWDMAAIDDSYKGPMPKWFSDEALVRDDKKVYVVQESELHENDWLQLLMEVAFYSKTESGVSACKPLEIKKVVVQTLEEYTTEAREKLKADNAIFYISYKCIADPSTPWAGEHDAIIRKTMDGKPGHMSLEVAEIQLNLQKRRGHGLLSVIRPKFSGVLGEALDVAVRWSGDVITVEKTILEQSNSRYELQGEYVLPGSRDRDLGQKEAGSFFMRAMTGHLGSVISSMGRWRMRLEVPKAEVAEMLPLARLLSRSTDPAVHSRSKVGLCYC